jgi:hypothetical protein
MLQATARGARRCTAAVLALALLARPTAPQGLPTAYQAGMLAWYDVSGVNLQAMQWTSRLNAQVHGTLGGTAPVLATDTANATTGNQCSMQYLSGATTSSITFPQVSFSGTGFTMCTVSRYTNPNGGLRIFQDASINSACSALRSCARGCRLTAACSPRRSGWRAQRQPGGHCLLRRLADAGLAAKSDIRFARDVAEHVGGHLHLLGNQHGRVDCVPQWLEVQRGSDDSGNAADHNC